MDKKQKKLMLSDEDLKLLDALCGELVDTGIELSQSDVVALALREVKAQGGVLEVIKKRREKKTA